MIDRRASRALVLGLLAGMAAAGAHAATRTYVTFDAPNDESGKLGMPGISVQVSAPSPDESAAVRAELSRGLGKLVYTRPLGNGEAGDYALQVTVLARSGDARTTTIPFEATLRAADGRSLWRIEGRTEVEDAPVAEPDLVAIGRNVLAALIHDGWVQPRYDVNDPPPAAPRIRRE